MVALTRHSSSKPRKAGLAASLAQALRTAWCLLNGTHRTEIQHANVKDQIARTRTYCTHCGKTGRWRRVPAQKASS